MGRCEVCANEYKDTFTIKMRGREHFFDSFECAIHALAPKCLKCGLRIIGHGMEAEGKTYCGAHCARQVGFFDLKDQSKPTLYT